VRTILEEEIRGVEERARREAAIFETAGGYSPTMGIIGTVLGLINVLGRLADTENLGSAIALAFIATLYGIALANLFWLPVANKLKLRSGIETYKRELIVAGVMAIQSGENPRIVQEKLVAYVDETKRRAVESIKAEA
jgi:chemotaxis protein MotA